MSYQISLREALQNIARLVQEGGANAVKLEGATPLTLELVSASTCAGVPVCGHIGLTPQSVHQMGGYRVQGRDAGAAKALIDDARALEATGVFAIVLECVPGAVAQRITEQVNVPTIGIGAGPDCDGQVLVAHDLVGLTGPPWPRFVKPFADARALVAEAAHQFQSAVRGSGRLEPHIHERDPPT